MIVQQEPISIYCSADTPMEDSFAFQVEFRSNWNHACREGWVLARGITLGWLVTLLQGLERAYCLFD
jgi:hypothetical protein